MIGLLQRVSEARVVVANQIVGQIQMGLLVFLCAERGDDVRTGQMMLDKILAFRMFSDGEGKMNRSVRDIGGALLLVPQFTLAADTRSGTRPSFTPAAAPDVARHMFDDFVQRTRVLVPATQAGVFGADMKVHLINDGPVTFWLRTPNSAAGQLDART